jgi:CheY-like chemotaxis protein
MSHELRTLLNSLLMLTGELRANPGQNLTAAQVQYATMIQSSGMDLLQLLTDVLGNGHEGVASPPARRVPELVPGTIGRHDLGLRPAPQTELAASIRLAGNKVLVVDDDFRSLFAITALLERNGLEVVAAESGEAGIAVLKETQDMDIILMDIMMPGMDGCATMREIHKMPGTQQLPIIALTGRTGDEVRQRCVDAGASAYVSKPVSTRDLLDVLCEWLPRPKMTGRPVGVSS